MFEASRRRGRLRFVAMLLFIPQTITAVSRKEVKTRSDY